MKSLKTTPTKLLGLERLDTNNSFSFAYSSVIMTVKYYSNKVNSQIKSLSPNNRPNLAYLMNIVFYKHFCFILFQENRAILKIYSMIMNNSTISDTISQLSSAYINYPSV